VAPVVESQRLICNQFAVLYNNFNYVVRDVWVSFGLHSMPNFENMISNMYKFFMFMLHLNCNNSKVFYDTVNCGLL
jgi:hypothetical protein